MIVKMDHRGWIFEREGSSHAFEVEYLELFFLVLIKLNEKTWKKSKIHKIHVLKIIIVKNSNNFLLHDNIPTTTAVFFVDTFPDITQKILMTMMFNFRVSLRVPEN